MFCPGCGLEDSNSVQFCRSCGTDLRSVSAILRDSNQDPKPGTPARVQLGHAIASRIQEIGSPGELRKALPELRKLVESPEEQRLRRIRLGSIVSFIGLGAAVGFLLASIFGPDKDIIIMSAMGFVTFCIGLALTTNGMFFTLPRNSARELETSGELNKFPESGNTTNDLLMPPSARTEFSSVTENTTRHLKTKVPVSEE